MAQTDEERPGRFAADGGPGGEGGDGVGEGVLSVGDSDELAAAFGVGLGSADVQEQPGRLGLDVGEGEGGELGASQCGGEAEQDDRGVACSLGGAAVDGCEDLADLGGAEWSGQPCWCGAEGAAQPAADLADPFGEDRVVVSIAAVGVGERGAGGVDPGGRGAVGGAVGEVGADRRRGGG